MARYDWGRGYGRRGGFGRGGGNGYGADYASRGDAWEGRADYDLWGSDPGMNRFWGIAEGAGGGARGYDRGIYGGGYPTYGGYPGGRERGMYYGGRGGYDAGMDGWGARRGNDWSGGYGGGRGRGGYDVGFRGYGYGGGGGGYGHGRGGYDAGYARQTFVPEEAYRRHPELDRAQEHVRGRWPDEGHALHLEMDDDEVRQAVRQNLHQDGWIHPERIQVEVRDGVVTLTGEVDDYMEARYAWDDAWETGGVRGVINHLTVRTDRPHSDHGDVVPQTSGGKRKK